MRFKVRHLSVFLLAITLTFLVFASKSSDSELSKHILEIGGVERIYYFHMPPGQPTEARPLVMVFHGGLGDGVKVSKQTDFNRIADKYGFAVVYPNSIEYWNDGRSTTGTSKNDTAFVLQLMNHLVKTENVDRNRIYATGVSNGGMFTLRLACELSDKIAAFAPVIASFPVSYHDKCEPGRAVPMMMINGTKDKLIQWKGGTIHKGAKHGAGGEVIPVPKTAEFWREHNKCAADPKVTDLPDVDKTDETTVKIVSYSGCAKASALEWVQVDGGGHTWPGSQLSKPAFVTRLVGAVSKDINASQLIWEFFNKYKLPNPSDGALDNKAY
ncbi:MAG: hydrolase [Gammaproteobacteria bacterium]|nr:hydrolase [Gammaproteobacteria bacterium]